MPRKLIVTLIVIAVLGIAAVIVIPNGLYTLDETEQGLVLRFGEFKRVAKAPGIHGKIPFVESVVKFDDRVLRFDAPPIELITKDKQFLVIDAYGRYQIIDPKRFFESLRGDIAAADARLGEIINGELRKEIALFDQRDIIKAQRDRIEGRVRGASDAKTCDGPPQCSGREGLGITIIDVRMKRTDFPPAISQDVYNRMTAERQRLSAEARAEGAEQDFRIRADADRQRAVIIAIATKHSNVIRGCADAVAVKIFADAFNQDPEFFAFSRTLEAYTTFLSQNATVVLDAENELFRYLSDPAGLLNGELPTGLPAIGQSPDTDITLLTQDEITAQRVECEEIGLSAAGLLTTLTGTVQNITGVPGTSLIEWTVAGQLIEITIDSDLSGLEGTDAEVLIGRTDFIGLEDDPATELELEFSLILNPDATLEILTVSPLEG
ncbi:MAG: protease modulator HflC [Dehalococcoidia bacterium]